MYGVLKMLRLRCACVHFCSYPPNQIHSPHRRMNISRRGRERNCVFVSFFPFRFGIFEIIFQPHTIAWSSPHILRTTTYAFVYWCARISLQKRILHSQSMCRSSINEEKVKKKKSKCQQKEKIYHTENYMYTHKTDEYSI